MIDLVYIVLGWAVWSGLLMGWAVFDGDIWTILTAATATTFLIVFLLGLQNAFATVWSFVLFFLSAYATYSVLEHEAESKMRKMMLPRGDNA